MRQGLVLLQLLKQAARLLLLLRKIPYIRSISLCIPYTTCIHRFLYIEYSSKEFIGMEKCAFPFLATYYEKVKGAKEARQTMKPGGS